MVSCPLLNLESVKKKVSLGGTSGRVYVPKKWIGDTVLILRLTEEGK